jgi:hypothetical protein
VGRPAVLLDIDTEMPDAAWHNEVTTDDKVVSELSQKLMDAMLCL